MLVVVIMNNKYNINDAVCFFIRLEDDIKEWFSSLGYLHKGSNFSNTSQGTIKGIHIDENNQIYYDIQTYSLYGGEAVKLEQNIAEEHIFKDIKLQDIYFKKILCNYLDNVIDNSKKLIENIEKYKETIKND